MTTKELIAVEIDKLSGDELQELYDLIREFTQMKRQSKPLSLMSRLKLITIDGPADFAAEHDAHILSSFCGFGTGSVEWERLFSDNRAPHLN